ncbi:HPr(Ser) kinase/phosphatase [Amphibacillus xylanus]|uniref:HPr kinase/phosphorylase n=1 Tax=Amphibacillus xylanus (strain ATCC 51415 / DSM 6626 / JCM 7361 / LMG 17667 / NBRC 15112 / Ep01) TaxID=698758 RepID=K0J2P1_AMPXN|nr:HPr(Ser) kinase/phosphatase [Amphibacillus xylanus]BAM46816.1 HPr kinase/phosphorylase [Amphibacillus xylanus NBRC 15112]
MSKVQTKHLIKQFNLKILAGEKGLDREFIMSDISRPGIELTGYFRYYPKARLQVLGKTEISYLNELSKEDRIDRAKRLCTKVTPCIVITRGLEAPQELIDQCNEADVPLLSSPYKTTRVVSRLTNFLEAEFAPFTTMHGVLVDIHGVGVLITGQSGVGKSETALELVKRGHRLVADDSVEIRQEDYDRLIGSSPELIEHLLEIRGLGIINVMTLFGASAVRSRKEIDYVINLEIWNEKKQYDRIGIEDEIIRIIDVEIPKTTLPVRPGRNLAVIIEVAAMNFRLKRLGVNAAEEFSKRLTEMIEKEKENLENGIRYE